MLMPSLWVPSGRLPKEAMTRPLAGQRNLPGVAAAVAWGAGDAAGAGSPASLRWVPIAAVFCSPVALITRGWFGRAARPAPRAAEQRGACCAWVPASALALPGTDSTVPARTEVGEVMPLTRCSSASDTLYLRAMP